MNCEGLVVWLGACEGLGGCKELGALWGLGVMEL